MSHSKREIVCSVTESSEEICVKRELTVSTSTVK